MQCKLGAKSCATVKPHEGVAASGASADSDAASY